VLPCDPRKVEWGLFCFIIFAAVVEVVVSTISVATCSRAVCCKRAKARKYDVHQEHVGYLSRGGMLKSPVATIPNFGTKISNSVETAVFTNATFLTEK